MIKHTVALFYLALFCGPLFAREKTDVIVMKNRDRITCEVKGLDADTLYISVDYILNTSAVDWSKVDHIESKQLFIVKTQGGLVYSGTLSTPEAADGRPIKIQILEPSDNKVELDKTQVIQMDETSSNFFQRFNGDVGLGVIYSKGNQSTQYNFTSQVNYPRERWATSASYSSRYHSECRLCPDRKRSETLLLQ